MTFRERTLAIFRHDPVDNIVYQPRIEHWYGYNKARGTLPERYQNMDLLEVYDDLGCSIRSYNWFNGCLKIADDPSVTWETIPHENGFTGITSTPAGKITTRIRQSDLASHTEEYPIKTAADADVLEYILRNRRVSFDNELYEQQVQALGDRCAPMLFIPRVNMQRLLIELVGWQETMFMLADDRKLLERLVHLIDETDREMLEVVAASPVPIINYGDNIDEYLLSPNLFEEFVLPQYRIRGELFRAAGKFTHTHFDGNVKHLLKFSRQCMVDGFEALTPEPQGDLTIEEMKEALGDDLVLLDGIPMTSFLPHSDYGEFEKMTRRVIETFYPNLILGISDEPSPVCDIERVRRVGEILEEYAS